MEKFKFIFFAIVTLALMGFLGYWSVTTIQSGPESRASQKLEQLEKENEDLNKEIKKLTSELGILQSKLEEPVPIVKNEVEKTIYKYQSLIDELQKMIDNKVFLKQKSLGASVGTVQRFLNIYNNTSSKVDNDYGVGTVKAVTAFQKAVGLDADGEAGSATFSKMIDWLKKQV